MFFHHGLVGLEVVFQLGLGFQKVRVHGAPARINHVGHPVAHPEGAVEGKLGDAVVLPAERLRNPVDAAVHRHIGHHGGVVQVKIRNAAQGVRQPGTHAAYHGEAALLAADGPFAEHGRAVGGLEVQRLVAVGRRPGTGADIACHVQGGAFVVVAHVPLDVAVAHGGIRLNPQRQFVVLAQVPVQERQIAVHHFLGVVAPIKTPHAGLAVADGAPVQRTIGFAEAEIGIGPVKITHFAGKGDDVCAVHGVAVLGHAEAQLLVHLLGLRELTDAAGVGIRANVVVRDAAGHPDCTHAARPLADKLHDPGLFLVADGKRLAGFAVAIFLHQCVHDGDGFPCRCRPLQRQVHKSEIVQRPVRVAELFAASPGGFHDGNLLLVHQTGDGIRIRGLCNVMHDGRVPPAAHNHLFAGFMLSGGRIAERPGRAEAVAVIGANDAPVHGSFFPDNKIGAGVCMLGACEQAGGHNGQSDKFFHDAKLRNCWHFCKEMPACPGCC